MQQAYEKSLEEIQSPEDEPLPPMGRLPRKRRDPLLHLAMDLALESTFAKHEPPKDADDITVAIVTATRKFNAAALY